MSGLARGAHRRRGRWLPFLSGGLLALAAAQLITIKVGWLPAPPSLLAATVAALIATLLAEAVFLLAGLRRRTLGPLRGMAGLLVCSGLVAACSGGMANWLLSLQGAVVLTEGDAEFLGARKQLQEFEAGWLSDLDEMRMDLALRELELRAGKGGYYPESQLELRRGEGAWVQLTVSSLTSAQSDTLRFHQGAFGFSPRIVVLKDGVSIFDRHIPFLSRRQQGGSVSFEGSLSVVKEGLQIDGAVRLDTLDEQMRGHPALNLSVRRGETVLGSGDLLPGHFADISEGYRIGFAGLKKWSEIDISRKNYPLPIYIGFGMVALGALLWPLAVWRRW